MGGPGLVGPGDQDTPRGPEVVPVGGRGPEGDQSVAGLVEADPERLLVVGQGDGAPLGPLQVPAALLLGLAGGAQVGLPAVEVDQGGVDGDLVEALAQLLVEIDHGLADLGQQRGHLVQLPLGVPLGVMSGPHRLGGVGQRLLGCGHIRGVAVRRHVVHDLAAHGTGAPATRSRAMAAARSRSLAVTTATWASA